MIYKLQKRNEELEDMLLERDLHNEKRFNDMKTMCLYSHIDCKVLFPIKILVDCHVDPWSAHLRVELLIFGD